MAYDTRRLLHYFRLLPDRRFLFGMRGGIAWTPRTHRAIRHRIIADFQAMFPAWRRVGMTHFWSGLACLTRSLVPFTGPIDYPGFNMRIVRAAHDAGRLRVAAARRRRGARRRPGLARRTAAVVRAPARGGARRSRRWSAGDARLLAARRDAHDSADPRGGPQAGAPLGRTARSSPDTGPAEVS